MREDRGNRKRRSGLIRFLLPLLLSALLITSCGGVNNVPDLEALYGNASRDLEMSYEDSVIYTSLYSSEAETLNYLVTTNFADLRLPANTVDCLVDYDSYGNVLPGLAESWRSNENNTIWTFQIRKGVYWVDRLGTPIAEVKADDWVAAAEYVNNAAHASQCRYMFSTGSVVKNAEAYYDYTDYMLRSKNRTLTTDEKGHALTVYPEVKPEEIGVRAPGDYTLVYTLEKPCPFFLSVLSYSAYMPVNREFLRKVGDMFGANPDNLLYNGAYLLTSFKSMDRHVLVKNERYWDKEHVYIDGVEERFRTEDASVEKSLFRRGDVDYCEISMDQLESWMTDVSLKDEVHPGRPDLQFSYFYSFNFHPQFGEEYEPENWKRAVCSENFRRSIMYALDRESLISLSEPYTPEALVNQTICPEGFVFADGEDYTDLEPFRLVKSRDAFSPEMAENCRDRAIEEFQRTGVKMPVKILMPYNPSIVNWQHEAEMAEKQLEGVLGRQYIDVIPLKGPETSFLATVRRNGNYALMKCNWGADYQDPQTWTEPFAAGNTYSFWDRAEDMRVKGLFNEWEAMYLRACAQQDTVRRMNAFAEAEAFLINHAIAIPFSINQGDAYVASRLNVLEGEYAPFGVVQLRYKGMHLNEHSMSIDEFRAAYDEWEEERLSQLIR